MSYSYQKRSVEQLEQIAEAVFRRYARRCSGHFVDIEGIVEDCDLTLLPREGGLRKFVEGYVATDPHYIVIAEQASSYAPRYRPIIAEEFCHVILEYDLLADEKLPAEAQPHSLTKQQHDDIESDARYLSRAILFPREKFVSLFQSLIKNAPTDLAQDRDKLLRYCAEKMETEFHVWSLQVAYRARDLGLITDAECRKHFSDKLLY